MSNGKNTKNSLGEKKNNRETTIKKVVDLSFQIFSPLTTK